MIALTYNYVASNINLSISDVELEKIHSVHGLSALLAGNCQMKYQEQNSEQYLSTIYRAFLLTFALRYQSDFVWDVFQLLQFHLLDETNPELLQVFAEINSEDSLLKKINQIKITADHFVAENKIENTAKAKLVYLARHQTH